MHTEPRADVLTAYRKLRTAGHYPAQAMTVVRDSYANTIALAVACHTTPDPHVVNCWVAATTYANSMTRRTLYWWGSRSPAHHAARAAARPTRSLIRR